MSDNSQAPVSTCGSASRLELPAVPERETLCLTGMEHVSCVAVFSGHLLDAPDRLSERFPARLADAVKLAIKSWLSENHVLVGFSSAACGADILFQEAISELGGETHVILPFCIDEFIKTSVAVLGSEANDIWIKRARDVLRRAGRVVSATDTRPDSVEASYAFANEVINGLALIRQRELKTKLLGLAVHDGRSGGGPGGTASMLARWNQLGIPACYVDLAHLPTGNDVRLNVIDASGVRES